MIIETPRQYRGTQESARGYEEATAGPEQTAHTREPVYRRALRSSLESRLYERYLQVAEYERQHPDFAPDSMEEIETGCGWDLIRARIHAGLRQCDLAEQIGVSEETIRE